MKVALQTLQNNTYNEIEIFLTDTIIDVKKRIESRLELGRAEEFWLCFKGIVLEDEQVCKDIGINEKSILVVIYRRPMMKSSDKAPSRLFPKGNPIGPLSNPKRSHGTVKTNLHISNSSENIDDLLEIGFDAID